MNVAFLCLGGNMGDRLAFINEAKVLINRNCGKIVSESGIYETQAWGTDESPDYYNQCLKLETDTDVFQLLKDLLKIESELGRVRNGNRNEARFIDIDILFYNDACLNESDCEIPHPRLHLRQFVLNPMNEIASNFVHPILNKSIAELLKECTDENTAKKIEQDVHLH